MPGLRSACRSRISTTTTPRGREDPTADKPQSKLWYTDGFWWALMTTSGGTATHIFKLDPATHEWDDTGRPWTPARTAPATRCGPRPDRTLTVVARDSISNPLVSRFTYSPGSDQYTLDSGFPITVDAGGGSESATIDRDSTGRLWIAYTRAKELWVAHSDVSGLNWTSGFHPSVGDYTLTSDDIASVIAFNGKHRRDVVRPGRQRHAVRDPPGRRR